MPNETPGTEEAVQANPDAETAVQETPEVDALKEKLTDKAEPEAVEDPEPSTEETPAEEPAAEEEGETEEPATGAPETYDAFEVPEGYAISDEQHVALSEIAKEQGLTQPQAQAFVTFDAKRALAVVEADKQAAATEHATWETEKKKQYGDGLPAAQALADKAFSSPLFSEGFRKVLVDSGYAKSSEFFNHLVGCSKLIGEDTLVNGGKPAADPSKRTLEDYFK